jgi:hypothetical protein
VLLQRLLNMTDADVAQSLKDLRAGGSSDHAWQPGDSNTGLQELLTASIRQVGADKGIVQKLDALGTLHICAHFGYDEEYLSCFRVVSANDNRGCGRAVRSGKLAFIQDVELDPD